MLDTSDIVIGTITLALLLVAYICFGDDRQRTVYEIIDEYAIGRDAGLLKRLDASLAKFGKPPHVILDRARQRLAQLRVAFMVIDFQNDFVTGSLQIGAGDAGEEPANAISTINRLSTIDAFHSIVFTKDWHPAEHISFVTNARLPDRELSREDSERELKAFDEVNFVRPRRKQILYPPHCIAGTWGAEIIPEVEVPKRAVVVEKGTETLVDSYSAFMDNEKEKSSPLEETLKAAGVDAVVGCGLAYDICVAHTLRDAARLRFYTAAIKEASAALLRSGLATTAQVFREEGIAVISAADAASIVQQKQKFPLEWVVRAVEELTA